MQEKKAQPEGNILEQIEALKSAYMLLLQEPAPDSQALAQVRQEAATIVGNPSIKDYGLAANIAACLEKFLDGLTLFNTVSLGLIKAHIDALYVIFHDNMTGEGDAVGQELLKELTAMTATYKS